MIQEWSHIYKKEKKNLIVSIIQYMLNLWLRGECPLQVTIANSLDPLFDILMVFLKELFEKVNFEKNQQMTKSIQITQHALCAFLHYNIHCGTFIYTGTFGLASDNWNFLIPSQYSAQSGSISLWVFIHHMDKNQCRSWSES